MHRVYGGVLGFLAFAAALARGIVTRGELASTLLIACVCLLLFASIGYMIGRIADWIVEDSLPG